MTGPSSLPYWEKRWAANATYDAGWPDEFARSLELEFLSRNLPLTGSILDLGCGPFSLSENERLRGLVRGRYRGVDGSMEAIQQAHARGARFGDGWEFEVRDLSVASALPSADCVMTKRFLQNLAAATRQNIWPALGKFPHGILIEDLMQARHETDMDRERLHRERLEIPEFNWPIMLHELNDLRSKVPALTVVPFMGWFYAITRVFPNLPRSGFEAAFHLSYEAIRRGLNDQPFRGPVVAMVW